jgi:hypothetical protein
MRHREAFRWSSTYLAIGHQTSPATLLARLWGLLRPITDTYTR